MPQKSLQSWVWIVLSVVLSAAAFIPIALSNFSLLTALPLLIWTGVALVLWVAVTAVALALVDHILLRTLVVVGAASILILSGKLQLLAWVGSAILLLFVLIAMAVLRRDVNDRRTYRTTTAFGAGTRYLIYAALVALATTYAAPVASLFRDGDVSVTERYISTMIAPVAAVLSQVQPGFSTTVTVDDLVRQQVGDEAVEAVPEEARSVLYQQVANQFGLESVEGESTVSSLLAQRVNEWLVDFAARYPILITAVVLLAAVLILRILVSPLTMVTLLVIAAIVWIGKAAGGLKLTTENEPVESIRIT